MKRVIVIGAGVIGASIAFRLAQAGATVTVLDRAEAGRGTSSASFAWVNANSKTPREYFELNVAGMREHAKLADEFGVADWLHPTGNLYWTRDDARYDELIRRVERLQSWGYTVEWLTGEDVIRRLEPKLQIPGPTMPVAWFPEESWLDAPTYVNAMLGRATEHGATFIGRERVVGICADKATLTVNAASGEQYHADAVVNAAGPFADEIATQVGRRLPMSPTKGLLVRVATDEPLVNRLIHSTEVNVRPDGDGFILLHHDSVDPLVGDRLDIPVDDDAARELCRRARRILPGINPGHRTETRIGVRPYPSDGVSCVGAVSGVDGYYEAVTHSGVTLSALIGRLLTNEILTGEVDPILTPFRPDRFS
jgi:glycine/D-amino acid oxidase-like deaminating enzyme